MKGVRKILSTPKAAKGEEKIIFKNKQQLSRIEKEQLELFADIIIDIYLQQPKQHEQENPKP